MAYRTYEVIWMPENVLQARNLAKDRFIARSADFSETFVITFFADKTIIVDTIAFGLKWFGADGALKTLRIMNKVLFATK